jgi:hypothetical protein
MLPVLLALTLRLEDLRATRDRGQGTLEYVGMVAVAALLVGVVVTAFGGGSALGGVVSTAISKITSIV